MDSDTVRMPVIAPQKIVDILTNNESPFVCRRKMDKSAYEIVENTAPEWRTLIPNEGWVAHGEFPDSERAWKAHAQLVAQWKWRAIRAALAAIPADQEDWIDPKPILADAQEVKP
jgi:hypothetical protein